MLTLYANSKHLIQKFYFLIPKRFLFILASLVFLIVEVYLILVKGEGVSLKFVAFNSLIPNLLILVSVGFGLRIHNLFKVVLVPFVMCVSALLLLSFFPNLNTFFKLAFALASALVLYFILLSINIFLVVEEKGSSIPLIRPARSTFLLFEIYTLFLFITSLYKILLPDPFTEITFIFQSVLVFLVVYFFSQAYWWSQNLESEVYSFVGNESLTIAFIVLVIAVSLSFFSTESFFRALTLVAAYYILISFFESVISHKFTKSQYWEYLLITILIILFLILE